MKTEVVLNPHSFTNPSEIIGAGLVGAKAPHATLELAAIDWLLSFKSLVVNETFDLNADGSKW